MSQPPPQANLEERKKCFGDVGDSGKTKMKRGTWGGKREKSEKSLEKKMVTWKPLKIRESLGFRGDSGSFVSS